MMEGQLACLELLRLAMPGMQRRVLEGTAVRKTDFPRAGCVQSIDGVQMPRRNHVILPPGQEHNARNGSRHMPAGDARRAVDDLAASTAFEETFLNTHAPFSGTDITVPVTVSFGTRDWILLESSRRRDLLPGHTTWVIKKGWGHVPMWIDPAGVSQLILEGTR